MKKIYYFLTVFIVLLFTYLFFFNNSKSKKERVVINSISETINPLQKNKNEQNRTKTLKKTVNEDSEKNTTKIAISKKKKPVPKKLTYLQAYRQYKFVYSCIPAFQALDSTKGFLAKLTKAQSPIERFITQKELVSGKAPSQLQVSTYQKHLDECAKFLDDDMKTYFDALINAEESFQKLSPVTEEEIALSGALEIEQRIKESEHQIQNEKSGENLLTLEEKNKRIKQIIAVTQEMQLSTTNSSDEDEDMSEEQLDSIKRLVKKLNQTMMPNANVMNEKIKFLQEEIQKYQYELSEFFKDNQTPDVFQIFADNLLNAQKDRNFIDDELNEKVGIYDESYIKALNKVVIPLMLCSLSYPCGPESTIAIDYCIKPYENNQDACGKNLEDFLLDDYLSKNQLIDVFNYLNFLLNKYA